MLKSKKAIIISILILLIAAICLTWFITGGFVLPGHETTEKYSSAIVIEEMTDEVAAALWEKPRGCFILDNFLYYGHGKERYGVRTFTGGGLTGHDSFVYLDYKDFRFARLNLDTMQNEEITRQTYEDTFAYMDFCGWHTVSEPITTLHIFVWLDNDYRDISGHGMNRGYNGKEYKDGHYDVYFTLRNGANPVYKDEWYEYFIYHIEPSSNNRYVPLAPITNSMDELNQMLSKYPDVAEIAVYSMNAADFTEEEIAEIAEKIFVPDGCVKTILLW
ncbi:MAG: hypothetical protein FWF05_03720 [Oscillospiraceae bacterium]|nr:hypothetical protein [Oscillospiraceae bacterium]